MAERSHVSSVEAIEAFRAAVIVYLSKARPAVEEISNEVMRTGLWLENDQRNHWIKEIKILTRKLEEAQQELFTARLSKLQQATAAQEMALHRTKRQLREAEDKQAVTKKWSRELENRSQPLLKEVEQLHTFLTTDMVHAVQYLGEVVKTLEAYAGIAAPGGGSTAEPSIAAEDLVPATKAPPSGAGGSAGPGAGKGGQP